MKGEGNNWSRAALVVAHPSHELRVHGWMQTARPHVFVLTDGSGRISEPRLQPTTRVLEEVGARPASIYGRVKDLDVYDALIKLNFPFFIQLAQELAEEFERQQIEYVVGDSDEGYSSTHDACRLVIDAAVEMVRRRSQRQLVNFDFAVVSPPDECPDSPCNEAIRIHLNDEAFARKVAAMRGYSPKLALDVEAALRGEPFKGVRRLSEPQLIGEVDKELTTELLSALRAYPALEKTVKDILSGTELDRFRTECLRPVCAPADKQTAPGEVRFYELYGKKLVAAGHYSEPICHADHFLPLAEAVWRHVEAC